MIVGVLILTWEVPAVSLKEKRGIMRPIIDRARARFNASVAEVQALDDVASAVIGIAVASNDRRHADSQIQTILRTIEGWGSDAVLAGVETHFIDA